MILLWSLFSLSSQHTRRTPPGVEHMRNATTATPVRSSGSISTALGLMMERIPKFVQVPTLCYDDTPTRDVCSLPQSHVHHCHAVYGARLAEKIEEGIGLWDFLQPQAKPTLLVLDCAEILLFLSLFKCDGIHSHGANMVRNSPHSFLVQAGVCNPQQAVDNPQPVFMYSPSHTNRPC